jgi:hypothetical protein
VVASIAVPASGGGSVGSSSERRRFETVFPIDELAAAIASAALDLEAWTMADGWHGEVG